MNMSHISRSALLFALLVPFCEFALAGVIVPEFEVIKDGATLGKVGDPVDYTIIVQNTGFGLLTCEIEDPLLGLYEPIDLEPGSNYVINAQYIVQPADPDPLFNEVTVRCAADDGSVVERQASHETNLFQPAIAVDKTGDELSKVGDPVDYIIILSNLSSADTPDMNCVATDSLLGEVFNGVLSFGDTVINLPRTVQPGDPDPLVNTVTLICSPDGFPNVLEASALHETNLFQPSGGINKTADPLGKVDEDVTYDLMVANSSSADTPPFECNISDPLLALDLDVVLLPGETWQEQHDYTVQPGDPDPLVNTMNVLCGIQGFPNQLGAGISATTELFQPAVEVIKEGPAVARPGETITYHFTINNLSSPDSPNLVLTSVTDNVLGLLAPPVECDLLPPGGSCSFDVEYTIPTTATGPLLNVVTVLFNPEGFPSSDVTDTDDHTLEIERAVSIEACKLEDGDADPSTVDDRIPVPGWTMQLTIDGIIIDEQLTGEDGCYHWEDLPPPALDEYYAIHEVVPPDWFPWTPTSFVCDPIPSGGTCSYTFVNSVLFTKELTSGPDRDGSVFFEDFASMDGLTLNGNAVPAGPVLRLTSAISGQTGNAFTTSPLMLGPGGSFSTHFAFQMSNPGGLTDVFDGQPGADGLTFIVHNDPAGELALGGAGAGIGYSGISNSLAVEFDSWWNDPDYFDVGDLDGNHIGVGINGMVGSEPTVAVADTLNDGAVFYAWIDYDGMAGVLEVRLSTTPMRPAAATLIQSGLDLPGLLSGTMAYVGFTSGTGAAWGDHDILYWHFMGAIDRVVPINVEEPTAYDFTITWNGDDPVWISDRVPAEWDVTHIEFDDTGLPLGCGGETDFVGPYGEVLVSRGGKPGKKCISDTGIGWIPGDDNTLNVQTLARCHEDGKGKKGQGGNTFCRPTSCGALYLNYGAVALEMDSGEVALDREGNPIVVAGPTEPICLAAVDDVNGDGTFVWDGSGDEDGDGFSDYEEACGACQTDPCVFTPDSDDDNIPDACDVCPLDSDNDADGDGVCGDVDNCPDVYNPGQEDYDGNGIGDACEACPCFIGISPDTPYFMTAISGTALCPDGSDIVFPATQFNFIDSVGMVSVGYQEYCDAPTEYSCGGGPAGFFSLSQTQYETCLVGPGWPPSDPD